MEGKITAPTQQYLQQFPAGGGGGQRGSGDVALWWAEVGQGLGGKSWREFHSCFLKICKLALKPHDLVKSEDGWLPVKSDQCFQCRPICLLIGVIGN